MYIQPNQNLNDQCGCCGNDDKPLSGGNGLMFNGSCLTFVKDGELTCTKLCFDELQLKYDEVRVIEKSLGPDEIYDIKYCNDINPKFIGVYIGDNKIIKWNMMDEYLPEFINIFYGLDLKVDIPNLNMEEPTGTVTMKFEPKSNIDPITWGTIDTVIPTDSDQWQDLIQSWVDLSPSRFSNYLVLPSIESTMEFILTDVADDGILVGEIEITSSSDDGRINFITTLSLSFNTNDNTLNYSIDRMRLENSNITSKLDSVIYNTITSDTVVPNTSVEIEVTADIMDSATMWNDLNSILILSSFNHINYARIFNDLEESIDFKIIIAE